MQASPLIVSFVVLGFLAAIISWPTLMFGIMRESKKACAIVNLLTTYVYNSPQFSFLQFVVISSFCVAFIATVLDLSWISGWARAAMMQYPYASCYPITFFGEWRAMASLCFLTAFFHVCKTAVFHSNLLAVCLEFLIYLLG